MDITEALAQLDPDNNDHWTADGAPRVDVVAELTGNKELKRADITNAAPDFHRSKAGQPAAVKEDGTPEAEPSEGEAQEGGEADNQEEEADATEADAEAEEDAPEAPEAEEVADQPEGDVPAEVTTAPEAEPKAASVDPSYTPVEPVVMTELEEIEAEAAEKEQLMLEAQRLAEKAKQDADRLADEVNALNRKADNLRKHDPNHDIAGIRTYIRQQNANRLHRAAGLQRFISTTGVHPADVTKAVDPRAPIDQAMSQRKPARGSQRPALPRRSHG